MISILSYTYIALVAIIWLYCFCKSKSRALCFLILSEVIYMNYSSPFNIDFVIKILILITDIFALIQYGIRKHSNKTLALLIVLFFIGLLGAKFNATYTFYDNILAYFSTFIGFLTLCIKWPSSDIELLLKRIAYIPIFSIIAGIILMPLKIVPFFTRTGNIGVGGASMATNLSFFGVVGIIAALSLYYINNIEKYRYLAYINFFIIFLTLTRGGILAGAIAILPDVLKWIKEMFKYKKKFFITIVIILISIAPVMYVGKLLIERSFVDGEFSTSGRTEAWEYILNLIRNKVYGNGFGYLKTLTDSALRSFTAAHNEYVRIYLETGILGLITHAILLIVNFKSIINNTKIKKTSMIFFILAFFAYSFTDNTLTNFRFWIPYVFVMSLISENMMIEEKEVEEK